MSAFTDRFLRVPIKTFDPNVKHLTGKSIEEEGWLSINPFEIACYRADGKSTDDEIVSVTFKFGLVVLVYATLSEFEEMLNSHFEHVNK